MHSWSCCAEAYELVMHQTMTFVSLCVLHVFLLTKNVFKYGRENKSCAACMCLMFSRWSLWTRERRPTASHPSTTDSDSASVNSSDRLQQPPPFFLFTRMQRRNSARPSPSCHTESSCPLRRGSAWYSGSLWPLEQLHAHRDPMPIPYLRRLYTN